MPDELAQTVVSLVTTEEAQQNPPDSANIEAKAIILTEETPPYTALKPANSLQIPVNGRIPFLSVDNAREMAERSWKKRRELKAARLAEEEAARQAIERAQQMVEKPSIELACARAQLDKCNEKLKALLNNDKAESIDIERLTRSVASLRDQVRILEGRPLPGNRRPGPERAPRGQSIQPLD
jgi:hypothetical protein